MVEARHCVCDQDHTGSSGRFRELESLICRHSESLILPPCHPERSSSNGEADAATESKDPYPLPGRVPAKSDRSPTLRTLWKSSECSGPEVCGISSNVILSEAKVRRLRGVPGSPDDAVFVAWRGVRAARRNPVPRLPAHRECPPQNSSANPNSPGSLPLQTHPKRNSPSPPPAST